MEVSMLRLAWLPIAQHVFQPALTGRLELISRKIVSSEQEQRLSRCADFTKKCLPRIECKELPRFREKYIALLGTTFAKFAKSVGKKMGSNMRPRYIQFRDIHDRDISGLHCIEEVREHWEIWNFLKTTFFWFFISTLFWYLRLPCHNEWNFFQTWINALNNVTLYMLNFILKKNWYIFLWIWYDCWTQCLDSVI